MTAMEQSEVYTEKLMNMIMDLVDDIIVIHDSEHTITWMNRAGEKAFGVPVDEVIGSKCHSLFNNSTPCADCVTKTVNVGAPVNVTRRRIIPRTGVECDCTAVPYYENGKLELVVQHLRPVNRG
ncbi:MAG: PAS domain-containing protein [Candidatus Methanomethylophilaceae archaeon]|nr:PAS domain-containing protein [Candidatus Methanomethylophilaceae archaeon]